LQVEFTIDTIKLSIRTPQATSLGKATSFNKHKVEMFFANLGEVYDKYNFQCQDIYNVDETAVTTVQKPIRIIAGWSDDRRKEFSGHHGSGCKSKWKFYPAILRIPKKEL
jgi:hypothetical protein